MSKYYVVKVGRKPGVYNSWPECQAQVTGFPGAVYKSFTNLRDANSFLGLNNSLPETGAPSRITSEVTKSLVINTDGGCTGNGYAGARAGIGITTNPYSVELSERVPVWNGRPESNQRAELFAVVRTFEEIFTPGTPLANLVESLDSLDVTIRTDSQYTINCFENWSVAWRRSKWTKEVENKDLVKYGLWLIELFRNNSGVVNFLYVKGHSGDPENDRADELAESGKSKTTQWTPRFDLPPDWN